jgi:hypothetical protein
MSALLAAAELLTRRLRILQKLQAQARERGETIIELNVAELFEPGDQAAIDAWEAAVAKVTGQQPLPWELSA